MYRYWDATRQRYSDDYTTLSHRNGNAKFPAYFLLNRRIRSRKLDKSIMFFQGIVRSGHISYLRVAILLFNEQSGNELEFGAIKFVLVKN